MGVANPLGPRCKLAKLHEVKPQMKHFDPLARVRRPTGGRGMNVALPQEFSDRSLDSIKSHRKSPAYRALVIEAMAEVQQEQDRP